jgi:hypothetical protein
LQKKKSNSSQRTANPDKIYFVSKCNVKVYPVNIRGTWYIESNNNNIITTFDKPVQQKELNSALAQTIEWYYNKLKKERK